MDPVTPFHRGESEAERKPSLTRGHIGGSGAPGRTPSLVEGCGCLWAVVGATYPHSSTPFPSARPWPWDQHVQPMCLRRGPLPWPPLPHGAWVCAGKVGLQGSKLMVGGEGRRLPWASPAQGSTVCLVLGPTQVTHTQAQLQPPELPGPAASFRFYTNKS